MQLIQPLVYQGTPGGALFRAINTIASNLKDEFPNIAFDTLAYVLSLAPES